MEPVSGPVLARGWGGRSVDCWGRVRVRCCALGCSHGQPVEGCQRRAQSGSIRWCWQLSGGTSPSMGAAQTMQLVPFSMPNGNLLQHGQSRGVRVARHSSACARAHCRCSWCRSQNRSKGSSSVAPRWQTGQRSMSFGVSASGYAWDRASSEWSVGVASSLPGVAARSHSRIASERFVWREKRRPRLTSQRPCPARTRLASWRGVVGVVWWSWRVWIISHARRC